MQLLPLRSQLLLLLIYLLIHLLLPFFPLLLLQLLLLWSPFTVCNARCRRSHDVAIHCLQCTMSLFARCRHSLSAMHDVAVRTMSPFTVASRWRKARWEGCKEVEGKLKLCWRRCCVCGQSSMDHGGVSCVILWGPVLCDSLGPAFCDYLNHIFTY